MQEEYKNLDFKKDGVVTFYDATLHSRDGKPCAVTISESEGNTSGKFHELKGELMEASANGMTRLHNGTTQADNRIVKDNELTVYADNGDNTFTRQTFEYKNLGQHPAPTQETMVAKGNSQSIHNDAREFEISDLQGRGLSNYEMPDMKQTYDR